MTNRLIFHFFNKISNVNDDRSLRALNFFRFLAASIVVMFHFGASLRNKLPHILFFGSQMVTFFFVLSGFIMVYIHYFQIEETSSTYYIKRIARLYPIYLVALLMICYYQPLNFTEIILNLAFLQAYFPHYALSGNPTGWSLSVEFFFYIIFPFLIRLYRRMPTYLMLGLSLMIFFITQMVLTITYISKNDVFPSNYHNLLAYFPLNHLSSFLLGNALGVIFIRFQINKFNLSVWLSNFYSIFGILFIIYDLNHGCFLNYIFHFHFISNSLYALSFMFFIFLMLLSKRSFLLILLRQKLFTYLGEISYSLYILQIPFSLFYLSNIDNHFSSTIIGFFEFYLSLIIFSLLSYKFIELPSKVMLLKLFRDQIFIFRLKHES